MPLAPDEAYYWTWSRALAPGYFDHPPMVALWILAGTRLAGDTALGIRLLGPLSVALGSVLLWDAADRLLPGRNAGIVAVSLLNATLLVGVGAIVMTPDSPLLLFWILALWAMARIIAGGSGIWWLAVGLFVGLDFGKQIHRDAAGARHRAMARGGRAAMAAAARALRRRRVWRWSFSCPCCGGTRPMNGSAFCGRACGSTCGRRAGRRNICSNFSVARLPSPRR